MRLLPFLLLVAPCAVVAAAQEPVPVAAHAGVVWHTDIEVARKLAAESGRHLAVSFDGRGWCGFCEKLHAEVFDQDGFGAELRDDYVFVALDFDARMRPRAAGALGEQHAALREALEIERFPTVVLMTADGVRYADLAYEPIGLEAYTAKLGAERAEAVLLEKEVPAVRAALVRARTPEDALAVGDAATALLLRADGHALARPLVPMVRARLADEGLDVEREKAIVAALSAAGEVDDDLVDRAFRLDPRNAEGLPEAALAGAFRELKSPRRVAPLLEKAELLLGLGPPHDAQRAARLYGDCAFWAAEWLDQPDRAAVLARFALSLEPESPGLRSMLEGLSSGR